ncbi:MAG: TonB-dependent receptor [Candidatus Cloacimonetes bacterium]|nr:TonB-dependent receptor [Candidatus Cloacimonadota bacterium]
MKHYKGVYLLIILLFMSLTLFAQKSAERAVSATIVDEAGVGIEKVSIYDGKKAVFSDELGRFTIISAVDSLYLSRLGYVSITLSTRALPAKITMQENLLTLPTIRVQGEHIGSVSRMHQFRQIEKQESQSLRDGSELLLTQASVSTQSLPLKGEYQNLSLLGNLARHTLVMIDGVAQSNAGEAFDFSKIPASQISRIEIIEGSSSALGGSSAIGGIINIITTKPQYQSFAELEEGIGSYGLHSRRYHVGNHFRGLQLEIEYSHFDTDNNFKYYPTWAPDEIMVRTNNRKVQDAYLVKAVYSLENQEIQAYLNHTIDLRQLPGPVNFPALYDHARQVSNSTQGYVTHSYLGKNIENDLRIWYNRANSVYDNRESTNSVARSYNDQSQSESGVSEMVSFSINDFQYEFGTEIKSLGYRMKNLLNNAESSADLRSSAFFARLGHDFGGESWQGANRLALRHDVTKGESFNSWRVEHRTKLWYPVEIEFEGSLGTAFSVPSIYDRYWIGDSFAQGNIDLKSESAFGYKLSLKLNRPHFSVEGSVHHNEIKDLIQWRQTYFFGPVWKPFNVGKVKIDNQQLNLSILPERAYGAEVGISFSQAVDISLNKYGEPSAVYGKTLPYTPEYSANVTLRYSVEKHGIYLLYKHNGKQFTTADNLIGTLPATGLLDCSLYKVFKFKFVDLRLDFKLSNILNQSYESYAHVPRPGRNYLFNMNLKREW